MQMFERDMRTSNSRIETALANGFEEIHRRQDTTNGRVRWAEKMIWLAMGGLGVLSIIVIPLLLALIKAGKV